MYKVCRKCGQEKHLSLFHKSSSLKLGVQVYCKECQSINDKKAREKRKANGPSIIRDSKKCNLCNSIKPISQFGVRNDAADGRLSYCKPCWTNYVKRAKKRMVQ